MPIDIRMAWRNVWRNPRRTLLTAGAIAFACLLLIFMLSFQFGSYETMINSSVRIRTGHLQIQAEGYHEKRNIRRVVTHVAALEQQLDRMQHVAAHALRANAFSLISSDERTIGALVSGIQPEKEQRVSTLAQSIRRGRYFSESSAGEAGLPPAVVGSLLAANLKVAPGDELTLLGQGRDGSIAASVLTVRGVFTSGIDEIDRNSIHIPLEAFQQIFFMDGAIHEVVVLCDTLRSVPKVKTAIGGVLSRLESTYPLVALDWEQLMPGLRQGIEIDLISGAIFYLVLILVVAFSILNTFLMAIFERTREFGVLMALGVTPGRLTKILMIESMSTTLLGIVAGIVIGSLLTGYFQTQGIDIGGSSELLSQYGISGRMFPRLSILSLSIGPLAVLAISFAAALYPALKIRGLEPMAAIGRI